MEYDVSVRCGSSNRIRGIDGNFSSLYPLGHKGASLSTSQEQFEAEEKRIYDGIFIGRGQVNPYQVRKEITDMMDRKAHLFRNEQDLSDGLRKLRELKASSWKHVDDQTVTDSCSPILYNELYYLW